MFFLSQFFSEGESDIRDFTLIYMSAKEAVIYFFVESILLPMMQLNSVAFVTFFWYLYAAEFFWLFWRAGGKITGKLFDN